jgi:hypothetical protein
MTNLGLGKRRPVRPGWYWLALAGYGTMWDRWRGGLTMLKVLLIDVALCAALIMVAALIVIRRWRRSSGRPSTPVSGRGAATEQAGQAMAPRQTAIVPGFSDTVQPDPGAHVPAQRGQTAQSPARPVAGPEPGPHGPGAQPHGQQAAGRAGATSEQIASYYDQADRPMAGYLAALGWTQQPPHSPESPDSTERARQHPPQNGDHRQ